MDDETPDEKKARIDMVIREGAAKAAKLMEAEADYDGSPADLVADIMHWCSLNGKDFEDVLDKARFYLKVDKGEIEESDGLFV
jgi:hypothetical protein